ncbi:MAG TPA: choice-of-anchor L domain-containing protein, partial [Tepidisphaeraceae bacterium]|nr:choice-of-anchor L domain-containing protein [Tepidisphaeraceae bacterium]
MRHPKLQHACNAVLAERLERRQLLAGTGLDVTPTLNANSIVHALLGGNTGIVVTSFHLSAQQKGAVLSSGTFTNPGGVFGLGNGIIMSTGDVSQYTSPPPTSPQTSTQYGGTTANSGKATDAQEALLVPISGNQISHFDVTELDLTFNMPKTLGQIFFNVVFGSAEFPQFVGSEFKDAFGLYVNGTNIATVDRQPVNIDHPAFVADTHTALNGLLAPGNDPLLHFSTFVGAGTRNNHLTFIVGDTSDHALDTTVYISALGALPPNPNIPVATVSAPDVTASQPTATFTVTYTDPNVPIQVGSIDSNDLIVTGPNGYSQIATLISVDNPTDGSPRVATYSVTGPSGGPFTVADDGTYVVSMQFQQVQDTAGDFVTEGGLGSFAVAVPGVTLAADPTFNAGTPKYNFSVTYIDPTGVKLTTIDNSDILVTNPANSFSQLAKRVSVSSDGDGRFTANYSLAAPNGKTWAVIDAGSYTFALQNGAVLDLNGSALPAGTLGTVVLTPFGGLSAPAAGEIPASGGAVAVAGDALGRQFIAYFDTVDSDLKYFTRMPNGAVSPNRVIDASPGAGAQLGIAIQHNLPVVAYYDSTAQQLK